MAVIELTLSAQFAKILSHFKKTGYNINVLLQTACLVVKVSKGAKIRNRYNQVPHLTKDTNGKVTNSQVDTTARGDHKAHINGRAQRHSKHKTEKTQKINKRSIAWKGQ